MPSTTKDCHNPCYYFNDFIYTYFVLKPVGMVGVQKVIYEQTFPVIYFLKIWTLGTLFSQLVLMKMYSPRNCREGIAAISHLQLQKGTVCSQYLCCDLNNSNMGRVSTPSYPVRERNHSNFNQQKVNYLTNYRNTISPNDNFQHASNFTQALLNSNVKSTQVKGCCHSSPSEGCAVIQIPAKSIQLSLLCYMHTQLVVIVAEILVLQTQK